jgi:hypothetical protein
LRRQQRRFRQFRSLKAQQSGYEPQVVGDPMICFDQPAGERGCGGRRIHDLEQVASSCLSWEATRSIAFLHMVLKKNYSLTN